MNFIYRIIITIFSLCVVSVSQGNEALNQDIKKSFSLDVSSLEAQLKETVALVFNDESEEIYGDIMGENNKLHLDKLCQALKEVTNYKPRAIFIDIDLTADKKAAECILNVSLQKQIRIITYHEPSFLFEEMSQDRLQWLSNGHVQVSSLSDKSNSQEMREVDVKNRWLNPETRVLMVKPGISPFNIPASYATLISGIDEKHLRDVKINWVRRIAVTDFSEEKIPKVSYQEAIAGKEEKMKIFTNKYVFVGVDQDKYDAFSNSQGEIVNGVFIHQYFLAGYLALMNYDGVIPRGRHSERLYFLKK